MKKSLILLASMLICPMLAGCSGGGESSDPTTTPTTTTTTTTDPTEPVHVHSYDEFGICDCGDIQEKDGIKWIEVGKHINATSTSAGAVELFKLQGAPDHGFSFSLFPGEMG